MGQKFTYTFELDAEIERLQTKLNTAQKALAGVMQSGKAPGIEKSITSIEKAIGRLQEKASTPITSEAAFGSLQKESSAIGLKLKELTKQIDGLANLSKSERFELLPPDTQKRVSEAASAVATFTAARDKAAKKSDELIAKERALAKVTKEKTDLEAKISKNSTIKTTAEESAKAISREIVQLQARQKQLGSEEDALKRVEAARKAAEAAKASGASPAEISFESGLGDAQRHLDAVREVAAALLDKEQAQKAATATAEKYSKTIQQDQVRLQGLTASYDKLDKEVRDLEAAMKSGSSKQQTAAWKELRQAAENLGVSMDGIPVRRSQKAIDELLSRLNKLEEDGYKDLNTAIEQYSNDVKQVITANDQASSAIARGNEEFREQKQIMSDRNAFLQRIKDFVGLRGAAMLARTTLRAAVESVKELDAVMTEMSVVTDLSVGDYWDQLPEYTARASALGLSIKDAYEAATLFYQQGLKTNEVVSISNETLKMARIAGLSAEDATNKMTAALRGFNMELNETSAQKVSDVYSKLAAITASDVNEISTAMTKTASIASSAGMEFETTAAFLSQIIETTRESAETAGTAMKTVIARFQELKKDPAEIGEVDGEIVDANKIETALRSVGVALRDSSGQFRDLDDVFLELSSKWDTLDTNTQRYIATIAAGSRQQSRFIAMMSDYGRTQDLVNAANNSAGASNAQFEKTLESLESKLNQLKNAWDTFTMGIMNSDAIKFGIDILTKILNIINKVTEGFGGFTGTVSKLGLVFAAFKVGQKLVRKFSNSILGVFQEIGAGWKRELSEMQRDTTNTINNIKNNSPAQAARPSTIAEDGHYKTFREKVFEPVNHNNAVAKTSKSISTSVSNATEGTSLRETVASTTVKGGARNGMAAGGYNFAENISPAIKQNIYEQFAAPLRDVKIAEDDIKVAWQQLEAEIADMDILSAIDRIEAEMTALGDKTTETGAKAKASLTVTSDMKQGATTEASAQEPNLAQRVGSAVKDKVSNATNTAARAKNAAKASQAVAKAQGASLADTLEKAFNSKKISAAKIFDVKSLDAIKKQFISKVKELDPSIQDVEARWESLEQELKTTDDVVAALRKIDQTIEEIGQTAQGTEAKIEGITNDPKMTQGLGADAQGASEQLTKVGQSISDVGGAMMALGSVFGVFGEIFRSLGLDWVADAFDQVGKVIMFVGSALMMLPPIIMVINTALSTPPLGVILIIIGAVIAGLLLIMLIVNAIASNKNAAAAKVKELEEAAAEARESAQAAQEAYEELLSHKSEYDGLLNTIDSLTEGTTAWKEAMEELNAKVMELIALYPELAAYLQFGENGLLTIDDAGWDALIEAQSNRAARLAGASALAEYNLANAKADQIASKDSNGKVKYDLSEYKDAKDELAVMQGLVWGTEEYNQAMAKLRSGISATDTATLAQINSFDAMAQSYAANAKAADNYARTLIASSGSAAARTDENYNRIVNSLQGSADKMLELSQDQAEKDFNTGNQKRGGLAGKIEEKGGVASGDYFDQLATYSKINGGKEYTEEEIQGLRDKGYKEAEKQVMTNLQSTATVENMGKYVDEIYKLQEQNEAIGELYGGSLDIDLQESEDAINKLTDVSDIAKKAMQEQVKIVKQQRADIDKELQKIYGKKGIIATTFIGSYDDARRFLGMYNSMLAGAGREMATAFSDLFGAFTEEEKISFLNEYEDVNWSSSIEGAAALKEMIASGNTKMQIFANSVLELESNFYSATAQANEMYKALGSDTLKDLAEDGKISATEILELSKSNEKLATMLDNTGVSASTLGTYFELLEDGSLDANSATDDFIRTLEKLNRASATIDDSFAFIDTWEASRSTTEISESFSEMRDTAFELFNKDAFGDPALMDYILAFFTEETWQEFLNKANGDIPTAMRNALTAIQDFETNFKATWQDLASSGAIDGVSLGADGSVLFDFSQMESTEELRRQIMEKLGCTKEFADALIADAQTYGQYVDKGLKSLDVQDALTDWLSTAIKTVGDKKIIDEKQFKVFMEQAGLDPEVAKEALLNQGVEIKSALNEAGTLEDWVKEAIIGDATANGSFDLGATYELLLELGLDDAEARAQLEELGNSLTDVPFTLNGEEVKAAGVDLGEMSYNGIKYPSMAALMEAVSDAKVEAANKKAALDQAKITAQGMSIAHASAATVGVNAMQSGLSGVVNKVIDVANLFGAGLSHVNLGASAAQQYINEAVDNSMAAFDSYFSDDYEAISAVLGGTGSGLTKDAIDSIWNEINENNGVLDVENGVAYEEEDDIYSKTMDKEEENDYETPYDWLFVLNQELDDIIRKREKLERKYNKLLENENASIQDIMKTREEMLASLGDEREQQEKIIADTISNSNKVWENEIPEGLKAWLEFDPETGEVSVVDGYEDANIDADTREKWDEFIATLVENEETIHTAEDEIENIDDTTEELLEEGREESSDYFNRIRDALVAQRQEEIDALSDINDSVQEAQDALYDQIQKSIDEERQARENEDTEEAISDKESRLAYLRRDTSGANALEIAALEKELAEEKEDYRDTLIDQALTNLQDANAEAAEQREKQIALLEAQLEAYENSDEIWEDVATIFATSMEMILGGTDFQDTPMGQLLREYEVEDQNLNPYETKDWEDENKTDSTKAAIYYQDNPSSIAPEQEDAQFKPSGYLANDKKIASGALTHVTDSVTQEKYINAGGGTYLKESDAIKDSDGNYLWAKGRAYYGKQFLHGGLADFTGPAWLDGTKSSPELVLNAQDTHNFILLKDILSDILSGTSTLKKQETGTDKGGDNYYDIEINVENISEDYDVEQLADKIKSMIYEDSVYRNVNTINLIR